MQHCQLGQQAPLPVRAPRCHLSLLLQLLLALKCQGSAREASQVTQRLMPFGSVSGQQPQSLRP